MKLHQSPKTRKRILAATSLILTLAGLACDKPPPTNAKDIQDYVRNAQTGATVRRLDSSAQEYVDGIFFAYSRFRQKIEPVEALMDLPLAWREYSDDWHDEKKISERLKILDDWTNDVPDTADPEKKTRGGWYGTVLQAIQAPETNPQSGEKRDKPFVLPPDEFEPLKRSIRERLLPEPELFDRADPELLELDAFAVQCRELLNFVEENSKSFDPNAKGLIFTDASLDAKAAELWHKLDATLADCRKRQQIDSDRYVEETERLRDNAVREKQDLRRKGLSDESTLRRYRELELQIAYYDALVKNAGDREKRMKGEAKKLVEELFDARENRDKAMLKLIEQEGRPALSTGERWRLADLERAVDRYNAFISDREARKSELGKFASEAEKTLLKERAKKTPGAASTPLPTSIPADEIQKQAE